MPASARAPCGLVVPPPVFASPPPATSAACSAWLCDPKTPTGFGTPPATSSPATPEPSIAFFSDPDSPTGPPAHPLPPSTAFSTTNAWSTTVPSPPSAAPSRPPPTPLMPPHPLVPPGSFPFSDHPLRPTPFARTAPIGTPTHYSLIVLNSHDPTVVPRRPPESARSNGSLRPASTDPNEGRAPGRHREFAVICTGSCLDPPPLWIYSRCTMSVLTLHSSAHQTTKPTSSALHRAPTGSVSAVPPFPCRADTPLFLLGHWNHVQQRHRHNHQRRPRILSRFPHGCRCQLRRAPYPSAYMDRRD